MASAINARALVCTVITRNRLFFARVLQDSLARQHPGIRLVVLILDDEAGAIRPETVPFEIVRLRDLQLAEEVQFRFQYTAFQLCNAMKPHLLAFLHRRPGVEAVVYLDGDIEVFAPLDELFERCRQHDIVLTPHTTVPYPFDQRVPSLAELMVRGQFNAGCLGVGAGPEARRFLEWWQGAVRLHCLNDDVRGYFVDQKFLDAVPCLFPGLHIVRHDGINTGHFNLHARRVHRRGERWFCNDVPLVLFHYTMVRLLEDQTFYPYVNRPFIAEQPELHGMFQNYAARLEAAEMRADLAHPYAFDRFANGLPISLATRTAYVAAREAGRAVTDPFTDPTWMGQEQALPLIHNLRWRWEYHTRWPRRWIAALRRQGLRALLWYAGRPYRRNSVPPPSKS